MGLMEDGCAFFKLNGYKQDHIYISELFISRYAACRFLQNMCL